MGSTRPGPSLLGLTMPMAPKRPCNHPGCGALTSESYCDRHKAERRQAYDRERGSAHERGYTRRWAKASKAFLAKHPLCVGEECKALPLPRPATVTDHIVPHRGDMTLFWSRANWQPLCKRCHDIKTAREDGRWGQRAGTTPSSGRLRSTCSDG